MPTPVIVDSIRTPIGALGGALAKVRPDDLVALVLKELAARNNLDPALLDEVILGCANQAGEDNRNIARMSLLLAGFPSSVPGVTVNRLCASGLAAVNIAARAIRAGEGNIFVAGGVESMSRAPYSLPKAEEGFGFGNLTAYDTALGWRYPNPKMKEMYGTDSMGETAENIAAMRPHITREKQDEFSVRSHQRAIAAILDTCDEELRLLRARRAAAAPAAGVRQRDRHAAQNDAQLSAQVDPVHKSLSVLTATSLPS